MGLLLSRGRIQSIRPWTPDGIAVQLFFHTKGTRQLWKHEALGELLLMVNLAFLLAGSNLGDRKDNLEYATSSLAMAGTVLKISSYFETEPVGYLDQPWLINQAIELETMLTPSELLLCCQRIETCRGRIRAFPNAPRTLDIDILLYGNLSVTQEDLIIPHPRLAERKFVLEPLAQIAPDVVHPLLKKSIQSLLEACPDLSIVRQIDGLT
jgi:2-amino-4-hydroxy-6-hydroxymethyldihydropteridine diphosphokinase